MPDPGKSSTLAIMEMIDNVKIGRCANAVDKNICTGTPESCMQPASFVESVDSCRLHDDLTIQSPIANAQFGKCGGRCVWDDSDCRGQPFSPAKSVSGDECYCEDVEVGACQAPNNGQYYCAVSPKACDSASTFVKTSQLPSSVSCKLTEGGLQRTVSYKVMSHSSMTISSNVFTSSHEKNIGLVVGLTFGGIAALVACILVGRCILGKNKRPGKNVSNSKEDTSFETSPVPESNLPYVA